jgi:hypothetical protein
MTTATRTTPARAYRQGEVMERPAGYRTYKVTGTDPAQDRRHTRYVVAAPGDLEGIRQAFVESTGSRPDVRLNVLILPEGA